MSNRIIKDFMTKNVVSVSPEESLKNTIKIMKEKKIGSVLITDNDKLLGIFTDRDTIKHFLDINKETLNKSIKNFMTSKVIKIQDNENSFSAYNKMQIHHIRHLPVFSEKKLAGIISIRDLIEYFYDNKNPDETSSDKKVQTKELTNFQIRNIELLSHLYNNDAINDRIVETIRESELDYFSIIEKIKYLEQRVNIDEKTNLLKFRKDFIINIIKTASRILSSSSISEYNISFIRFDIDDFSDFNTKYGHEAGDEVLIKFAQLIKNNSRPTDYIIRFGGEEFDAILPSTPIEGATQYIEKIFKKMDQLYIERNSKKISITVSAGISSMSFNFSENKTIDRNKIQKDFKQLQSQADNSLYEAKYLGKSRYCIYSKDKISKYKKFRSLYKK
ncbi:MAG: GGDEF domain-containing protein [Spirochaetes bacterium]|nr:GGDEF domain-containing protein [Spirochaetota bacterium]